MVTTLSDHSGPTFLSLIKLNLLSLSQRDTRCLWRENGYPDHVAHPNELHFKICTRLCTITTMYAIYLPISSVSKRIFLVASGTVSGGG